jgi:hypothetical protein
VTCVIWPRTFGRWGGAFQVKESIRSGCRAIRIMPSPPCFRLCRQIEIHFVGASRPRIDPALAGEKGFRPLGRRPRLPDLADGRIHHHLTKDHALSVRFYHPAVPPSIWSQYSAEGGEPQTMAEIERTGKGQGLHIV